MTPDYSPILQRISGLRQGNDPRQMYGRCPVLSRHANGDKQPSLSIRVCESGKLIVRCGRGCTFEEIAAALGTERKDWFPPEPHKPKRKAMIEATYDYQNWEGKLLFQCCRLKREDGKGFAQRRPMPNGEWAYTLAGGKFRRKDNGTWELLPPTVTTDDAVELPPIEPVLFRLPQLIAHEDWPAIIVEGEKDVLTLEGLGLNKTMVVTTAPMGAGKWRRVYGGYLSRRRIAIIPDNDEPGIDHGLAIAASAIAYGAGAIRMVRWGPDIPPKHDITDWLNAHHAKSTVAEKRQAVLRLIQEAELWEPKPKAVAA